MVQVLKFLGLLLLGMTIYTVNIIYPFFSFTVFFLPVISVVRLTDPTTGPVPCRRSWKPSWP